MASRQQPPLPGPLVRASWLKRHASTVRIVDCRWYLDGRSGLAAYEAGHIPGAVFVDLDRELAGPASPRAGRHPLPTPRRFADAMQRIGVDNTTPVVAYDDAGGSVAARLWWLLHVHRHPVAVLDGGLAAWTGRLSTETPTLARRGTFAPRPWPRGRFVDADGVGAAELVIDARAAHRYADGDAIDPRPGHIPGAHSAPWAGNLDGDRFRPRAALRERLGALGAAEADPIVVYCGSGVTACHDLLALDLAGFGDRTALYAGSWSQWGADTRRPARRGPAP